MKWVDLSPYKPVSGAAVASTPIANGLQKVQDSLNSVGVAGAAIASAGTINITNPVHQITGVTAIATIADANVPTVGETVTLWIQTGLTIQNNGGGVGNIRTLSGSDRVCKANEIVVLLYDGAVWRETNPQAAGAPYRKTTAKAVNNTVAETDLLNGEITLAAGVLGTAGVLRFTASGDYLNNAARVAMPRFKLKLGATTIFDTGVLGGDSSTSASRGVWRIQAEIANLGAANLQSASLAVFIVSMGQSGGGGGNPVTFTTGEGATFGLGTTTLPFANTGQAFNTSAVDTTVAQALVLSVINGTASASYEVKLYEALAEII